MKKWVAAWIVFVLIGLMFFNNVDLQNDSRYWMPYFVWDKGKDVIALLAFMGLFRRNRGLLLKLLPTLIYLILRLVWEPLSKAIGVSINDSRANNVFFCLLALVYILIFLNESKWRSSK